MATFWDLLFSICLRVWRDAEKEWISFVENILFDIIEETREEMSKQGHNPRDLSRLWQRFVKQAKPFRKEMHGLKKQFCLKRLINLLMIVSGKKFLVLRLAISFVFPESSKTSMASSAWKRHKQRTASYSQSLPKDRKHSAKFPLNCAQTIPLAGWLDYLSKKIGFIEQDNCISHNTNNYKQLA